MAESLQYLITLEYSRPASACSEPVSRSCASAIGAVMFPKEDAAYAYPFPKRNTQSLEEPRI